MFTFLCEAVLSSYLSFSFLYYRRTLKSILIYFKYYSRFLTFIYFKKQLKRLRHNFYYWYWYDLVLLNIYAFATCVAKEAEGIFNLIKKTILNICYLLLLILIFYIVFNIVEITISLIIFIERAEPHTYLDLIIILFNIILSVLKTIINLSLTYVSTCFLIILFYHYIVYYIFIGLITIVISYALIMFYIEGELSNIPDLRTIQLGILCLIMAFYSSVIVLGLYYFFSNYFDFYLHNVILDKFIFCGATNRYFYLSNLNTIYNFNLESIGIDWLSGSSIKPNMLNLIELFPIQSTPDNNTGAESNLPSVVEQATSSTTVVIDSNTHLWSITTTENKVTLAVTLDKDSITSSIQAVYSITVNATKDFIKDPGASLTTAICVSAGTKAGVEIAKTIKHPAGKVAAIIVTVALLTTGGLIIVEVAKNLS